MGSSGELEEDGKLEHGEDFNSSRRIGISSGESQFGLSNRSPSWDRKTGLVVLLEVWLGNGVAGLGVGAVDASVILIMCACLKSMICS